MGFLKSYLILYKDFIWLQMKVFHDSNTTQQELTRTISLANKTVDVEQY